MSDVDIFGEVSLTTIVGVRGTSKSDGRGTSKWDVRGPSEWDVRGTSKWDVRGTSKWDVRGTSKWDVRGTSNWDVRGTSKRDVRRTSKRHVQRNSVRTSHGPPGDSILDVPCTCGGRRMPTGKAFDKSIKFLLLYHDYQVTFSISQSLIVEHIDYYILFYIHKGKVINDF